MQQSSLELSILLQERESMSNVISLGRFAAEKERPDAQFRGKDQDGKEMQTFVLDYRLDGKDFSVRVMAYDFEDAERHCAAIRESLFVAGVVFAEIMA